jgi:uncharacterized protein (TIGR00255 family)
MLKSMTGFGKATAELENKTLSVEIRSVNSKSLDLNMRMSGRYRDKDQEFRSEIARRLERGKIDIAIYTESIGVSKSSSINIPLAKAYFEELKALDTELGLNSADLLSQVMRMPDVLATETRTEVSDEEWVIVNATFQKAIEAFNLFRTTEGAVLEQELKSRITNIEGLLGQIEVFEPKRIAAVRAKLDKGIADLLEKGDLDKNRFEQELIYYIEKLDITEEKVRLRSHCKYFMDTAAETTANGRKLGFITQEIGREINTIGSKANDADMQQLVVQMKDELEKIKEQLLNIL